MKIPNPWFGPLPWNRLWRSSLAAGKRSRRFSPAVPCHAAEGTSDNLYTYLADTTLANSSAVMAFFAVPSTVIWSYSVGGVVLAIGLAAIFLRGHWQKARGLDKLILLGRTWRPR